ncbi:MAG: hypothetical protein M1541_02700, partial [Acidobacteria bacterium]|nr:hypothetical protein [Acidobacteriota bacterium]
KGCREMGMLVVTARVDPHSIHDDAARAHPEWVAVEAGGKPRRHWADPSRWVTCANGPYNFEFMTSVIREIVETYKVDGVFANRWQGHGVCYCAFCREAFKKATGFDLPPAAGPGRAEALRAWNRWHGDRMVELFRVWDGEIRKINPRGAFIANAGPAEFELDKAGRKPPILAADRQSRDARVIPPWINGRNAKEYRAVAGMTPVGGLFSIGRDDQYRWKDAVQHPPELKLWISEGIANGMRPWLCKFSGTLHDKRWLKPVEEIYQWHWENERYFRNTGPLARVAIVQPHRGTAEDHEFGFHQALVEARVPFELASERHLDAAALDRFKLLILPNNTRLSDAQCAALRSFVQRGGSLLAAYQTSLEDEAGRRRENFGLADLFGARFSGRVETTIRNSYMLAHPETKHPILDGFQDAGWFIGTINRVAVETAAPALPLPITRVPPFPDLPMEEVYPRVLNSGMPEVFLREFGKGRVVYFPGDIGSSFWEIFDADHARLIANAVRWALNEEPLVEVSGPGVLDVTVWRQSDSMAVHLVNLTNPFMMKGPLREILPAGEQQVRLRLPRGTKAKAVRLLAAGGRPAVRESGGALRITVPGIALHEVVAVDL